jgi:hypothetical protein
MKASDAFRRGMRDVADAVKHVAQEAERGGEAGSHIVVSRRTNIKIAHNRGRDGGTAEAFATQDAPIAQRGASSEGTDTGRSTEPSV